MNLFIRLMSALLLLAASTALPVASAQDWWGADGDSGWGSGQVQGDDNGWGIGWGDSGGKRGWGAEGSAYPDHWSSPTGGDYGYYYGGGYAGAEYRSGWPPPPYGPYIPTTPAYQFNAPAAVAPDSAMPAIAPGGSH